MRFLQKSAAAGVLVGALVCSAQQSPAYAGKWVGLMSTQAGGQLAVELLLTEAGGMWRMSPHGNSGRNNSCLGKDFPVSVKSSAPTELVIQVNGSKVLQGCLDETASFKSVDWKALEGTLSDGRTVKLERK